MRNLHHLLLREREQGEESDREHVEGYITGWYNCGLMARCNSHYPRH